MQCLICGKDTEGSTGAAGLRWPNVCQQCKDKADRELDRRVHEQVEVFRKFAEGMTCTGKIRQGAKFLGWPLSWFEKCGILESDGHLREGMLFLGGGHGVNFRMKNKYRRKAKWNTPNVDLTGSLKPEKEGRNGN